MKLSIVVPCYNETKNIPLILGRFGAVIKRPDIEVVLVDNNSSDDSQKALSELLPKYPFARAILEREAGYGSAVLAGLKEAKGEYIGWTHADMQTDPADVIRGLEIVEAKGSPDNIYVKGSRRGRPLLNSFFTFGMSVFESLYFGKILYEINAQPNIFHRSFFAGWQDPPKDFALDLYALCLAKRNGLQIERFPVFFPERIHGESSWDKGFTSKWKFIKRTVAFSGALKKKLK